MNAIRKIFHLLLKTIIPNFCVGCRASGVFICESCLRAMQSLKPYIETGSRQLRNIEMLIAVSEYRSSEILQKLIFALKYKGTKEAADIIAAVLAPAVKRHCISASGFVICPIPLHPRRKKWRGYNQSEILGGALGAALGVRGATVGALGAALGLPVTDLLMRTSYEKPQATLNAAERARNIRDCFALSEAIKSLHEIPDRVILVDDVATTCATLNEAARVLKQYGVKHVYAAVAARKS